MIKNKWYDGLFNNIDAIRYKLTNTAKSRVVARKPRDAACFF